MELLINIPEWLYQDIQEYLHPTPLDKVIQNGIPLPEEHGALIDADALKLEIADISGDILNPCYGVTYADIDRAPVVIAATKK